MRTLEQALHEHELITLRVMGEWWEQDLTGADKAACAKTLAETLAQVDMEQELRFLPPEEADALRALVREGGRMPVGAFERQHGQVRQMGPGRLEREEPWYEPVSAAEALWYRGFLYRGYDETDEGLVEYYFLPEELYEQFPRPGREETPTPTPPDSDLAPADPPAVYDEERSDAVDDLTTFLGFAQRDGLEKGNLQALAPYLVEATAARSAMLVALGDEMEMVRQTNAGIRPTRAAVDWLKQGREAQLRALADAWSSSGWNDLCHTPGLTCEGSGWSNDPISPRTALLDVLPRNDAWYAIDGVVAHIKETKPDFQRPDGNYDTWYIRDDETGAYLTGFENWDRVEGRLLRFLLEGPMWWLGLVEVGEGHYRLTRRALQWLADEPPAGAGVKVPLVVQPDATLLVPHNGDRYHRFQAARIAEPAPLEPGQPYQYRLTPSSLGRAREQGIQPDRVLGFLGRASERPVPASVKRAIERWADRGLEARLQPVVVLRVRDAAILDTLQSNPKTRPFLGERLGELAAVVQREDWHELQRVTAQLGLLLDVGEGE